MQRNAHFPHLMGMKHTRIAVTAMVLLVAVAAAAAFVMNGSDHRAAPVQLTAAGRPQPSSSPSSLASSRPVPQQVQLAGFTCSGTTLSSAQTTGNALVAGLRTGSHPGYDRLVVEFTGSAPAQITLTPQAGASFVGSPKGDTVTLAGGAGLKIVMRGADAHTAYSGALSFRPNGPALVEVRRIEDFEGYVSLGVGLSKVSCYHAYLLSSPTRLVIDVQAG